MSFMCKGIFNKTMIFIKLHINVNYVAIYIEFCQRLHLKPQITLNLKCKDFRWYLYGTFYITSDDRAYKPGNKMIITHLNPTDPVQRQYIVQMSFSHFVDANHTNTI